MNDNLMWELGIKMKRMDLYNDISSSYAGGLVEGFSESYEKRLTSCGLDKAVVRNLILAELRESGYRRSVVDRVMHLEQGEWEAISQKYPVDKEKQKETKDRINAYTLGAMDRFEKKHPDYFDEPKGILVIGY